MQDWSLTRPLPVLQVCDMDARGHAGLSRALDSRAVRLDITQVLSWVSLIPLRRQEAPKRSVR